MTHVERCYGISANLKGFDPSWVDGDGRRAVRTKSLAYGKPTGVRICHGHNQDALSSERRRVDG
jgi:hypothetical protein